MKRIVILAICGVFAAASASAATQTTVLKGHELSARSKISLTHARTLALKARPGRIVDQELEKEGGGSGLRYSFDVVSHGKTIEVGIDAVTGKVLENGPESAINEVAESVTEHD